MGVKISNLPIIVTPALSDVFPVVQGGVTYKESFTQLSSLFATAGANSNITSLSGLTTPLSIAQGGTNVTSVTTTPTATAFAGWDSHSNLSANNFLPGFATVVSAAGTTTLTVSSKEILEITGSTTQIVVMPIASTLVAGTPYIIINNSSGTVTVNSSGGNAIQVMAANTQLNLILVLASGTTAASWQSDYTADSAGVLSITGTANQVIASAATGNITLSLPQSIGTTSSPTFADVTVNSLTSSGNIQSTGGNVISGTALNGGPGQFISYANAIGTGSLTLSSGDNAGAFDNVLTNASTTAARTWTLPDTTGTIALTSGASGIVTSGLINQLAYYAATGTTVSGLTIANQSILTTNGSGSPAWSALSAGQILVGTTSGAPTATAINSGAGILVANGSGSITISTTGGGLAWFAVAGTTQVASVNSGYIISNASQTTIILPATAAFGSIVSIIGLGAGGWILSQPGGQTIRLLSTIAVSNIASAEQYDCIEVICVVANTTWVVRDFTSTGLNVT